MIASISSSTAKRCSQCAVVSGSRRQSAGSVTTAVTKFSASTAESSSAIASRVGEGLLPALRLVAHERDEGADDAQLVGVELRPQRVGLGRQPADGAELGRPQAELVHLPQHPIDVELEPPPRDLADAP